MKDLHPSDNESPEENESGYANPSLGNHLTDNERTLLKKKKSAYVEKAQSAALQSLIRSYRESDYNTRIDTLALLHACLKLADSYPRALGVIRKINELDDASSIDKSEFLQIEAWERRN